ncbi:hypothetical protein [Mycobacterium tilburgii]|uniref:hypothetical protein n=1 Tax=Mycobacterium tilburgii TaxID=44467 RepID=UPI0021B429C1|nr:hypothetical protein [Mycobacterium tilburgii]
MQSGHQYGEVFGAAKVAGSISSGSSGFGPVSRMLPQLFGRALPASSEMPFSGPVIHASL